MNARFCGDRQRGYALMLTLLLIVLLATTTAQLVTSTAVEAMRVSRRSNTLAHELAVDSMISLVAQELHSRARILRDLDRHGYANLELALGDCHLACRIVDDGAKFDVAAFQDDRQAPVLRRKLRALAHVFGVGGATVALRPLPDDSAVSDRRYVWFDQLFGDVEAGALFRHAPEEKQPVWSDVVTCCGSGRVDLRRASRQVLTVLLDDIDRSLARKIVQLRKRRDSDVLGEILRQMPGDQRQIVQARLAWGLERYALEIDSTIRGDHRRWYVVATLDEDNVEIHHRGQIRW